MAWAERAMALHYEDETASRLGNLDVSEIAQRSRIDTLLRSEYWRGQQHGHQGAPLHAHHMTPLCSTIPLGADGETASQPKDLVLFMPYLHWETDRKRFSFASFLDNVTAAHKAEHDSLLRVTRQRAIRDREDLEKPARFQQAHRPFEVMSRVPFDGNNQNRLGQYLMDASRLYEGISNYRDKKLLHKYLYVDAPIHPRRTLDQAYYWSLQSTDNRDRDQVVYRATTAAAKSRHQFDIGRQIWPDHENLHDDGPCQTCRDRVRQTSKLIMVDQLWLWVLDERTILTFFPRRYGTNEDDAAGVHKSIRTRLDHISKTRHPEQRMGSVWDLALIIFDECINTLFDRTKTPDLQPRVMDHFSQAIDDVTNKQAIASGRLWAWTEQWKKALSNKQKSRTADVHIALILDVRPEYKLLYEIKDIIEELNIIIHISRTHNTLLKSFVDQAKHIMDPGRRLQNMFDHGLNMDSTREPKSKMDNRNAGVTAKKVDYDRFGSMAEELVIKVDSRIQTLEDLKKRAESASNSVNELLNRKQQQSSVVQAWQSAQQTEDAVAQGQSVMLFTAVTIVFAPLSFMTSVFGMNSWEFSPEQNTWKILDQLAYILPISVATIMLVLFLAFNPSVTPMINAWYSRIRIKFLTQKIWGGYSLYKIWFGMNLRFGRTWTEQIQNLIMTAPASKLLPISSLASNPFLQTPVRANYNYVSAKLLAKQACEEQIGKARTYARKKRKEAAQKEVSKEHRERQAAREEARREKSM
ncbi:Magnesium transport protein CorA- transmembrane region [Apiospora arundinis]